MDAKLAGGVALGVGLGYALARLNLQAQASNSSAKAGGSSGAPKNFSGQKPLLVIGSLNADIILEISRFPKQGETLGARSDSTGYMVPGGKGANQAVAAARAGTSIPTCFVSMFGNDSHANALKDSLVSSGVDVSLCMDCDVPSGQAFIFLEEDGQNSILIVGGSNKAFPKDCVSRNLLSAIQGASAVMLQREIPEALNIEIAQAAKKAGVPVVFDMGGEDSPLPDELLPLLEFVCPNETELARLINMPTSNDAEVKAAALALQKKGVKQVLTTLGADGSILLTESGEFIKQPVFKVAKVVDTTGAGDCFRANFTMAMVEGKPLKECLSMGAAAASLCVQTMGAQPSMPERSQTMAVLSSGL
jgi:ribokinase